MCFNLFNLEVATGASHFERMQRLRQSNSSFRDWLHSAAEQGGSGNGACDWFSLFSSSPLLLFRLARLEADGAKPVRGKLCESFLRDWLHSGAEQGAAAGARAEIR